MQKQTNRVGIPKLSQELTDEKGKTFWILILFTLLFQYLTFDFEMALFLFLKYPIHLTCNTCRSFILNTVIKYKKSSVHTKLLDVSTIKFRSSSESQSWFWTIVIIIKLSEVLIIIWILNNNLTTIIKQTRNESASGRRFAGKISNVTKVKLEVSAC